MWKVSNKKFVRSNRPMIMAHRGNSIAVPENTAPAFQQAYELKVDCLETDAHLTKDGEIVFFHDYNLDRITTAKGKLAKKTLAELKELDMGYKFKTEDGNYPYRGQGLQIQTIEEVLGKYTDVKFNIDIKSSNSEAPAILARKLKELDAEDRVMVGSFLQQQINKFRTSSEVPTSAGPFDVIRFLRKAKKGKPFNAPYFVLQVPVKLKFISIVNEKNLKFAHDNNIAIHVWTINEEDEMRELLEMGVDGIFTDNPELLLKLEKEMSFY